ncbi:MAG: isoleucine--tRNA ligase [Planctomycetes bacterium UTPLA1]|nr:MAG: isoleucine--tRNA ligase [Planctomycetes bacterium UTPLA1]
MFKEVPSSFDFPKMEKDIRTFWESNKIYEQSLKQREGGKPFVFFEGPPTANGLPHPGHCLTRAIKDLFPRYKTMTGHYCLRKGGWDTHGLPVEVEVCKELGIHTKEEIENYGIEAFNRKCLESVFRYTKEWEDLTRRLGFWVNLDEAYVTYHQSYIESVWWSLKTLFDAGLLYQGHKIVWWWAQGGTALSSGEVGQGYREVDDPSVYVRFPLVPNVETSKGRNVEIEKALASGKPVSLLVWTTTPWTLPSNTFAAVHRDFDYAIVHDEETGERLIFAAGLVEAIGKKAKKKSWTVEATIKGADLVGLSYRPPFDYYRKRPAKDFVAHAEAGIPLGDYKSELVAGGTDFACWRILHADFVTLDSGTGLVHEAPAFGEVDYELLQEERKRFKNPESIPLLCAVAPNGNFTADAPTYKGRWVKDCDKDIVRELKERTVPGSKIPLLMHQEQYRHDYPFCWRAEQDPLIQYPRRSWFIRTTQFKDAMLENNQHINWLPNHIKNGRFGKFLESNVDWSLSRERYWGTPLPIWVCERCGQMEAVDSYDSLLSKPGIDGLGTWEAAKKEDPGLSEHLKVHKPYIDAITFACAKCAASGSESARTEVRGSSEGTPGRMRRVTEVIDCWYDSGAMPFAQWGWPHQGGEMMSAQFPADFISEALDQTRGWFYSLTAISTMLFGEKGIARMQLGKEYPVPFRNCIVLGLLMGEDGLKMSKSKKNYKEPTHIFEHEGADAMRWLFFSGQTPWTSIRFQEAAIAEGQREFLIRLYNCYSFFVIYANIDKWTPDGKVARGSASELDRWMLSALDACSVRVYDCMEAYDNYNAARALVEFVDALSNWYVRRSRERFWRSGMDEDKRSAYATLYHCLVETAKLIAPFTPFIAEAMYQNLVVEGGRESHGKQPQSIHLCDYPVTAETRSRVEARIEKTLNEEIEMVRQVVSCGRAARAATKLRVRQPLPKMELFHRRADLIRKHEALIRDELNVKQIDFVSAAAIDQYVHYDIKPDFKKIGPKFGPLAPKIKAALGAHPNVDSIVKQLEQTGTYTLTVDGQEAELSTDELLVELHAREGWAAERIPGQGILVLDTHLTDALRDEGVARDFVNVIQQTRKNLNLQYEQRIDLAIVGGPEVQRIVNGFAEYIRGETLAQNLLSTPMPDVAPAKAESEGLTAEISVRPV